MICRCDWHNTYAVYQSKQIEVKIRKAALELTWFPDDDVSRIVHFLECSQCTCMYGVIHARLSCTQHAHTEASTWLSHNLSVIPWLIAFLRISFVSASRFLKSNCIYDQRNYNKARRDNRLNCGLRPIKHCITWLIRMQMAVLSSAVCDKSTVSFIVRIIISLFCDRLKITESYTYFTIAGIFLCTNNSEISVQSLLPKFCTLISLLLVFMKYVGTLFGKLPNKTILMKSSCNNLRFYRIKTVQQFCQRYFECKCLSA